MTTELLTIDEVSAILKVHFQSVYTWLRDGRLKGIRVGVQWRVRREDLEDFLKRGAEID